MVNAEGGIQLEGIVYREGGCWVARCLTIDHAAQAKTPQSAIKECVEGLVADIQFAAEHGCLDSLRPVPLGELLSLLWDGRKTAKEYRRKSFSLPPMPAWGNERRQGTAAFDKVEAMAKG